MNRNRFKKFQYLIAILGILLLSAETYFHLHTSSNIILDIRLFFLLFLCALILERTSIRFAEFSLTLDVIIFIASYFLLDSILSLYLVTIALIFSDLLYKLKFKFNMSSLYRVCSVMIMFIISYRSLDLLVNNIELIYQSKYIIQPILLTIIFFLTNWIFLYIEQVFAIKGGITYQFKVGIVWDFYANMLSMPLSILLIYTYEKFSYIGIVFYIAVIILANLFFRLIKNLVFINNELSVVHEVALTVSSSLELKEITTNILSGVKELVKSEVCCLFAYDKNDSNLSMVDYIKSAEMEINIETMTNVINKFVDSNDENNRKMESFVVGYIKNDKDLKDFNESCENLRAMIYQPLIFNNEYKGCLLIASERANRFTKEQLYTLDTLANQAVVAMENARLYKEVKIKSIKDGLTGLYNQRYFFDVLDKLSTNCLNCGKQACEKCIRTGLVIFDIDHFKKINDTYGHQSGDKVLKDIADIIRNSVRNKDILSRYGGEEFTIILPDTEPKYAYNVAERIRKQVESTTFTTLDGTEIKVTISGGVSHYPDNAENGASLLAYADRAMYMEAKRKGRNKIGLYT